MNNQALNFSASPCRRRAHWRAKPNARHWRTRFARTAQPEHLPSHGQQIGSLVGGIIGVYFAIPGFGMAIGAAIGECIDPTR